MASMPASWVPLDGISGGGVRRVLDTRSFCPGRATTATGLEGTLVPVTICRFGVWGNVAPKRAGSPVL